jgi:hypothetical protein
MCAALAKGQSKLVNHRPDDTRATARVLGQIGTKLILTEYWRTATVLNARGLILRRICGYNTFYDGYLLTSSRYLPVNSRTLPGEAAFRTSSGRTEEVGGGCFQRERLPTGFH